MKKFIEKNFLIIVLIISVLTFFKGCSDSRKITDLKSEVITLKQEQVKENYIQLIHTKSGKPRKVYLTKEAQEFLTTLKP